MLEKLTLSASSFSGKENFKSKIALSTFGKTESTKGSIPMTYAKKSSSKSSCNYNGKIAGFLNANPDVRKSAGTYNTQTFGGGFIEEVYNADGDVVKHKKVNKHGDVVESQKVDYKKDKNGKIVSSTTTIYDGKNKKCGSIEENKENHSITYRDKNGKVLCKAVWDPENSTYVHIDAKGNKLPKNEAQKLVDSVYPKDKKYQEYIKDEAKSFKEHLEEKHAGKKFEAKS